MKISIIVQLYNEDYVEKCLNSIINQTYSNIEIIAVSSINNKKIINYINDLKNNDNRIKIINVESGLNKLNRMFKGLEKATGNYISFIDSKDYLNLDYYRLLINNSMQNNSDVVISNYVIESKGKKEVYGLTFNTNNISYKNGDFKDLFFNQTGRNDRLIYTGNKLIKTDLFKKVFEDLNTVKDNKIYEEIVTSSLLYYYAKNISFCDNAIYYLKNVNNKRIIESIINSFKIIKDKFKNESKYLDKINIWKGFYIDKELNKLKKKERNKELESYKKEMNNYLELLKNDSSWNNYQDMKIDYNEGFNEIKEKIIDPNIKVVSFDMFDTLVLRPFMVPRDMFTLLNTEFHKHFGVLNVIDFSVIRKKSEIELRNIKSKEKIEEVTLDQIYDYIADRYKLDKEKLNIIKDKEIEMEIHFCYRRNSGYELYELAKHLNKRVILTTDIYLSLETIKNILKKNGYEFDEYYLSSVIKKTKSTGSMYNYIKEKEKTNKILHIGDNEKSDYLNAIDKGIKACRLYRTIDVFMGNTPINVNNCGLLNRFFAAFNIDHSSYESISGVRYSISLAANKYFDNPYIPFNSDSDFNGSPYFIGYYALGMQSLAMCKWLIDDVKANKIDSICFMARDGYLPYEMLNVFSKNTKYIKNTKLNYTYVSRKSLMPLLFKDKTGISLIDTYLDYQYLTPELLIKQFDKVINVKEEDKKEISKKYKLDELFTCKDDFNNCLSLIYDYCFDEEKYKEYYDLCKEYFDNEFVGNTSVFDVGYSGKPEAIITSIINKSFTTYFIHTNNEDGFKNSTIGKFRLKTFFDFKPTITGALRELFISYIGPSCVGYKREDGKVVPVYGKEKYYNFYNYDMIQKIQKSAIEFIDDFTKMFGDYIEEINFNKYYLSLPLEYYYHYAKEVDLLPIKDLIFEPNTNVYIELSEFNLNLKRAYSADYSKGNIPKYDKGGDEIDFTLPRKRINRVILYTFKDRKQLKHKWNKWKEKSDNPEIMPNTKAKRLMYYMIFDRKKLIKKAKRK